MPLSTNPTLKVRRNPSYLASLKVMFRDVIFDLPSSAVRCVLPDVIFALGATGVLVTNIVGWVASRLVLVAAGLCGYLREDEKPE